MESSIMVENCVSVSFIHINISEAGVHSVTFIIIHLTETILESFQHDALEYKNTNRN